MSDVKHVAKLLLIDDREHYLMMLRSAHPVFPNDPDLPGGTLERDEDPKLAMVREVYEEAGVNVPANDARLLYKGDEFSTHNTMYHLYVCRVARRPDITISWEHESYRWMKREEFMARVRDAKDTYMHMTYEMMKKKLDV